MLAAVKKQRMEWDKTRNFLQQVAEQVPAEWLRLTTHRLDIYEEELAKTQFLEHFERLAEAGNTSQAALNSLPTAYDYIRLGHPLSCVLEWAIARNYALPAENVISFASQVMPLLAVLRKNLLDGKRTQICYVNQLPNCLDTSVLQSVYGYRFELTQVASANEIPAFDGSTVLVSEQATIAAAPLPATVDFVLNLHGHFGSVLLVQGAHNKAYVSAIQHVRRRESIAMTPTNAMAAIKALASNSPLNASAPAVDANKAKVVQTITDITLSATTPLVGSSGLSVQYAIMMGLVHHAQENHPGKAIKFVVPPNCYGGTNDQARRVAASVANVTVVDLPVDGDHDMVQSVRTVLDQLATENAVPYIIAEIPTNPRVEVPDLQELKAALSAQRTTATGEPAIDPVFILDQTFCPNVHFLGEGNVLSSVRAISYASGSKFPSGGLCTAGYCVANKLAAGLMNNIAQHLHLCDNEATAHQYEILAAQLPSMNQRIKGAYANTRAFVDFIQETLPEAKINFVSHELAQQGFTPSVFSLDLPTKGSTEAQREAYKRALNLKLIKLMISEIPNESKYCVSYGQLKGCYWTVPATSTQGTTKEGDKDYIARVACAPDMDLERHKQVFAEFVAGL